MKQGIEELKLILLQKSLSEIENALNDFDINSYDKHGNNVLHYFIKNEKSVQVPAEKLIPLFISRGINIDAVQSQTPKRTALQLTIFYQAKNILILLLANNANIDIQDEDGNVALFHAVMRYRGDDDYFIKTLISHNANVNIVNNYGVSPKDLAYTISNYDASKFFN